MLKVATYNINSIRARLEPLLQWLQREEPDVLCLQEIKVQDEEFPAQPILDAGYHVVFRGQKSHAGVAIISSEPAERVASGLDDEGEHDEPRLIRAVIRDVPVVNTYIPQGRSADSEYFQYKLEWLARLRDFFDRHYSPQEPLLWMGDFNVAPESIDVHDPKRLENHVDFHPKARAALEEVRKWGFLDLLRHHHPDEEGLYTYWDYRTRDPVDRNLGWRVDHIWATQPLADRSRRVWIDVEARRTERPSDHTYLIAEFDL